VEPGAVRAIEYEIVPKGQAPNYGLRGTSLAGELRAASEVGVLRCVDHHGQKLTVVGEGRHVRKLVASGQASDPRGIALEKESFPVVVHGWLTAK
jgi:hypothetical protein